MCYFAAFGYVRSFDCFHRRIIHVNNRYISYKVFRKVKREGQDAGQVRPFHTYILHTYFPGFGAKPEKRFGGRYGIRESRSNLNSPCLYGVSFFR